MSAIQYLERASSDVSNTKVSIASKRKKSAGTIESSTTNDQPSSLTSPTSLQQQSPKNIFHGDVSSSGQRKIHMELNSFEGSEHSTSSTGSCSSSNSMLVSIASFRRRANKRFRQHRNSRLYEKQPTAREEVEEDLDFHLDFENHDIIYETPRNGRQPPRRVVPLHALLQQRECTARRLNCSHLPRRFKLSVPFSHLETPYSEAVLGLDCEGLYAVALAGTDCGLALKFYGVPSRDQLERRRTKRLPCISPLLQTVRLNMPLQDDFQHESPVADFSVQIVTSNDWKIGAAIVRHSKISYFTRDDADIGSLVLFEMPSTDTLDAVIPMLPSLTCANVRIGGEDDFTIRNRLWKTSCVPVAQGNGTRVTDISVLAGYLLLHDEDDGFRLSWVVDKRHSFGDLIPLSKSTLPTTPKRDDIVTLVHDSSWEQSSTEKSLNLHVVMEAYLHVDALLDEIRSKRPDIFHYDELKCPDFYYRLISMSSCGRVAQIVVVFSNQLQRLQSVKKVRRLPDSIGVFLQIDLFTQTYREVEWGQYSYALDPALLRKWASLLALNRRMKEQRLGPFCLENPPVWVECHDWSTFLVEENTVGEPSSPEEWHRYLKDMKSTKIKVHVPSKIPYPMLYPDADVLSNKAVRRGMPIPYLKCRSGATEFVYG